MSHEIHETDTTMKVLEDCYIQRMNELSDMDYINDPGQFLLNAVEYTKVYETQRADSSRLLHISMYLAKAKSSHVTELITGEPNGDGWYYSWEGRLQGNFDVHQISEESCEYHELLLPALRTLDSICDVTRFNHYSKASDQDTKPIK